jgi:hypothetical protein
MANENAKIDENKHKSLLAVDETTGERKRILVDNATGALLVTGTVTVGNLDDIGDVNVGTPGAGDDGKSLVWVNASSEFQLAAGAGDVSKVGTPVDNQVGVWTGDGTIEGTAGLTYNGANLQLTGDVGATGTRITKGWFADLEVTNAIAGSVTGNAATVSTITGLAPDTATTQATQASITTCANLTTVGTVTVGNVDAVVTDAAADGATKGKAAFTATDFDAASGVISLDYANGQKASVSQPGFLTEIATAAETTTGTDAARAVSPDGLAGSDYGKRAVSVLLVDDATDVATGNGAGDFFWRVPSILSGYNLVEVAAQVQTAGTTGTTDIQVHNVTQTADMLSTVITIDSAETDSSTAATPAVIDGANDDVATADQIRFDVDAVSTTAPKGLLVELIFQLP